MQTYTLYVEKMSPEVNLPKRATEGSVGLDVCSNESVVIAPKTICLLHLGIKLEFVDPQMWAMLTPRSSLHKKGLLLANSIGIIDSDYRGEVMMPLYNFSTKDVYIEKGDRIGQIIPMLKCPVCVTEEKVSETKRGSGGFGSTGSY